MSDDLTPPTVPVPPAAPVAPLPQNTETTLTMSQKALGERLARAKEKAQAELLKDLGFTDTASAKAALAPKAPVAGETEALTRLQEQIKRLEDENAAGKVEAEKHTLQTRTQALADAVTRYATAHKAVDAEAVSALMHSGARLVDVQSPDGTVDEVKLSEAVVRLKADKPALFSRIPPDYAGILSNGNHPNPDPSGDRKKDALKAMRDIFKA